MVTIEQYLVALRSALNNLYSPGALRASPLVQVFRLPERPNVSYALQQALIEGIESLKVNATAPARSPLRRAYEVLLFRYVQQWSQQEVADQLGIGARHLRREQQLALEVLAQRLSERFQVVLEPNSACEDVPSEPTADETTTVDDELAWLNAALPAEPVDLVTTLHTTLDLVRPIARDHGVELMCEEPESIPPIIVHPVALRQILLSLLGMAVGRAPQGRVRCSAAAIGEAVQVTVQATSGGPVLPPEDEAARIEVLRRVLRACGGHLEIVTTPTSLVAVVSLPAYERVPVLVIDDNADTLALIRRYLAGTRYGFLGARTLAEALHAAQQEAPRLIVLDVMMPEMDGWEVLGRLRAHPFTQDAQIIICSILAEEELALSLGASAFVHKPLNREGLLRALDRQWAWLKPASR